MDIQQLRLPPEIVEEILCRLPVKSLARFRCVSKTWCALISASVFIHKHLIHSKNNHPGIVVESVYQNQESVYALNKSSWETTEPEHSDCLYALDLSSYGEPPLYDCTVRNLSSSGRLYNVEEPLYCTLDSCDGLLLLRSLRTQSLLWLCNPSTRKYKKLPTHNSFESIFLGSMMYGFGYNATLKDYQVISIVIYYNKSKDPRGEVYSLRNNSWRQIQVIPHTIYSHRGVFVNGAVHWITKCHDSTNLFGITAFNFAIDEFFDLPLPDYETEKLYCLEVVVLGGCLSLICEYGNDYDEGFLVEDNYFEGWMMKDYGVKESWTKLFKMMDSAPRPCVKKGELPMFDAHNIFFHGTLYLYKPEDKSVERLLIESRRLIIFAASYVESLVPLG